PTFSDPNDGLACEQLAEAWPERDIRIVDARVIFAMGGGIHCITQQQPRV
ncbi:MAG: agmatine deiminase family protein, partial [Gammaproteobacteria bacterium]|nr:agmatine deiminase family protein [Gammaproteobacteria bacterium]